MSGSRHRHLVGVGNPVAFELSIWLTLFAGSPRSVRFPTFDTPSFNYRVSDNHAIPFESGTRYWL